MFTFLASIFALFSTTYSLTSPVSYPLVVSEVRNSTPIPTILSERRLSLDNRSSNPGTNAVFKNNILLNLAYLDKTVTSKADLDWNKVLSANKVTVSIAPGELFAYHDDLLSEYDGIKLTTTNSHFNAEQGYLNSGYLYGDGVCHLASIINWVAQDAGLNVNVTKLHTIAPIPDIPAEFGVSIYTIAGKKGSGARNNLYISNNKDDVVTFEFEYDGDNELIVRVQS